MPPERIELRDLVLRRWTDTDAAPLTAALRESFEHLHYWQGWASHRPSLDEMRSYIDQAADRWDSGGEYEYGVFAPSESAVLGAAEMNDRIGPGRWEIGYWLHVNHTGRGIATKGAAALTEAALAIPGTESVEIHCDQNNKASAAVAKRLGYLLDRIEDSPKDAPGKSGRRMIWVMTRDAYPGSEAERRAISAR